MVKEEYKKIKKNVSAQEWLDSEYPKEKKILERKKENIVKLDINEEGLEDSLRLEDFAGLKELKCNGNNLTKLEIVNCPNLEVLYCNDNQLIELKIQNCPSLKMIYCELNKLVELNLSGQEKLVELHCYNNQLMKLELANCSSLKRLECYNNQLFFLDLTNCFGLEKINCYKNQLTKLEFNDSPNLENLNCYENKLSVLDLKNSFRLERLDCHDNKLTSLELADNKNLFKLDLRNNQLTSLDLTKCSKLEKINCSDNNLRELFLPFQGTKLNLLNVKNNNFLEQHLSIFRKFTNLEKLIISNDNKEKISQGIYNRFCGSLESLQEMQNLYEVDISNTDISSGLTYLPNSINYFYCSTNLREDAQVRFIANLLAEAKGTTFSQKLKSLKQKELGPKIDQVIFLVEQRRMAYKLSALDLWKKLKFVYNISNNDFISWQDYLKPAFSSIDLETRKNGILKTLKILKEAFSIKEKRFQEELVKQKEELEKKIKELEVNQLTDNERKILQKLEELFNIFNQFNDKKSEGNQELAEVLKDYQKLDFSLDTPNLSQVFKSGSENLFSRVDSFVEKINMSKQTSETQEKLQTEVVQLQTDLEKMKESHQELIDELVKKDAEIVELSAKKENLQIEISNLQKRIQKEEEELQLIPSKIKDASEEIKKHVYETTETTAPFWKKKVALEKEEKELQKSVKKSKVELKRLESEEKIFRKQLEKTKNNSHKKEINDKIKNRQEQIEKLEKELNSQLEMQQSLITQVEIKNNPYI